MHCIHRGPQSDAHSTMNASKGKAIDEVSALQTQALLHESLNLVSPLQESMQLNRQVELTNTPISGVLGMSGSQEALPSTSGSRIYRIQPSSCCHLQACWQTTDVGAHPRSTLPSASTHGSTRCTDHLLFFMSSITPHNAISFDWIPLFAWPGKLRHNVIKKIQWTFRKIKLL